MVFQEIVPWKKGRHNVSIFPGEEEYPLGALQRRMNRMLDDFFGDFGDLPLGPLHGIGRGSEGFIPRMDVAETDKEITLNMELAGIDEKDVNITLQDDVLTIRGEKKIERDEKNQRYSLTERSYGTFSRSLSLPTEIQQDNIQASFKKGVLTVRLPKAAVPEAKATKIEIKNEQ
jgi:HSP20 family protein